MKLAKNILVAVDFSVLSRGVVDHALQLAEMLDAKLNVISVHGRAGPGVEHERREIHHEMAEVEARLAASGRLARTLVQAGDTAETIARVAQDLPADMIVMGTNSRHGFGRLIHGSTAQEVLRLARVPVLIVTKAALAHHGATT